MRAALPAGRRAGALDRFATLAGGDAVLMTTTGFGRSPVRQAAYHLQATRRDLDLRLSWREFSSLEDWGRRWRDQQETFAAGLILSAAGDPIVERAVGRCMADLANRGRPLLWGIASGRRIRWYSRFEMSVNGWRPEEILPNPAAYARLYVDYNALEFRPHFDSILYAADPDFFISQSRLRWSDGRHFGPLTNGYGRRD